jgi:hypothetical protein
MTNSDPVRVLELATGLAVAGEALALAVGMHLLSPRPNAWISAKNDLLLVIDIAVGVGLVGLALGDAAGSQTGILSVCLAAGITTHLYREWQWSTKALGRFCLNRPLMVVNTIKLAGLLGMAALAAS